MSKTLRLVRNGLLVAAAVSAVALPAFAQTTVGTMSDNLRTQATSVEGLISVAAFIIGVGMVILGLLMFKKNNDNPNDPSASKGKAIILLFVGAGLVALPTVLGVGVNTLFGSGAQMTNATSGFTSLN